MEGAFPVIYKISFCRYPPKEARGRMQDA